MTVFCGDGHELLGSEIGGSHTSVAKDSSILCCDTMLLWQQWHDMHCLTEREGTDMHCLTVNVKAVTCTA